jgi:uncharacterized DUF497 family protein
LLSFDWDAENLAHIARHGVTAAEAEYVLNHPTVDLGFQDWHNERRFTEVGPTAEGRLLVVISTERGLKTRVVTAFDAPKHVVKEYFLNR